MPPSTSAQWIADHILDHDKVISAIAVSSLCVSVERIQGDKPCIAALSLARVSKDDIQNALSQAPLDFIVNIPKDAVVMGSAIDLAAKVGVPIGGVRDLFRGLTCDSLKDYQDPDVYFVLRSLRQHSRVKEISRLDNRRYQIRRHGLSTVIALILDEYEVTADVVRTALDKFGDSQVIVCKNPNAGITSAAETAANSANLNIWKWKEFYGNLSKQWP